MWDNKNQRLYELHGKIIKEGNNLNIPDNKFWISLSVNQSFLEEILSSLCLNFLPIL